MAGIGNDRAGRIWYRALTVYLTNTSNYVAARQAAIAAARDLYGNGSAEEKAVWNAFRAINVGPAWSAATCGVLDTGRELSKDDSISSCNNQYLLVGQADGNLVLYRNSPRTPLWNSVTFNNPNAYTVMQADGNLVVYQANSRTPLWNSGTHSSPGATAAIRDDGTMVITSPNGLPVWHATPPANDPVQQTSANNTSHTSAESLAAGKSGFYGVADPFINRFYKVTVAPGKTVTLDFVGGWLQGITGNWGLFRLDPNGNFITYKYSDHSNTRIIETYTNTSSAVQTVTFQVYRGGASYETTPFTLAIRSN